jgi:uncharacterized protein YqeY
MTDLKSQIQSDLSDAIRAKDETRKTALRMLISAIRNAEIPAAPEQETDVPIERKGLDDAAVITVIQKQVKQRRDSIEQFRKAKRDDLAIREEAELGILQRYLPAAPTTAEVEDVAARIIAEVGATGAKDMGKVIPRVVQEFAGRAEGRAVSEVVRRLLGA